MMYGVEKSGPAVVAVKPANKAASAAAERVELIGVNYLGRPATSILTEGGSAADGRFDLARSDFDFIVTFSAAVQPSIARHFVGLADDLERLLGRRVDLLTNQPIRNPYLRKAIEASRRDFYVRAPAEAS